MYRQIAPLLTTLCIAVSSLGKPAIGQVVNEQQPSLAEPQAVPAQASSGLEEMRLELQKLQSRLSAREEAQERIMGYLQMGAAWVALVSLLALALQFMAFRADSAIRRRSQEESVTHRRREDALNDRLMRVLDVTSTVAEQAQEKVSALQEGGIRRAAETLRLINNLLAITERAAAKAADAHYEFLSSSVENLDNECQRLTVEATRDDERDIIAKPAFIERVKILAKEIDSLDHQILAFNQSLPRQFAPIREGLGPGTDVEHEMAPVWNELRLTGPCFFIRGLDHHVHQNFEAAIDAWKIALQAKNASAVMVDASYWAGYVNNTLGRFAEAMTYIKSASDRASEQRKPELTRLLLETRFFALALNQVPEDLLEEGRECFEALNRYELPGRAISSFATTVGNMCMVQQVRHAGADADFTESNGWFNKAIEAVERSRWARFGKYQNLVLSNRQIDAQGKAEIEDVIGSVRRGYQNREEDRSKALSKITEYICMLMLGRRDHDSMSTIAGLVEIHTGKVTARTLYSQFRKQNVPKEQFLKEFYLLQESKDFRTSFYGANGVEI